MGLGRNFAFRFAMYPHLHTPFNNPVLNVWKGMFGTVKEYIIPGIVVGGILIAISEAHSYIK